MTGSTKFALILIYSNSNQQSLRARVAVNEFMNEHHARTEISVREVDFERDKSVANEFNVLGTPTTLIFKDDKLVKRHLGEVTSDELQTMIEKL